MKRCPQCETEKPETEFHRDRSRADGLKRICKDCFQENRWKKRDDGTRQKMMDDGSFAILYDTPELKKAINRAAKRYAKQNLERREELQQEGWLAVALSTGEDLAYHEKKAKNAIEAAYRRDYRARWTQNVNLEGGGKEK
jgi:hypothetical protein